jgi:fructose-1,6-bisphosphatase/sedoheptulose 1,7-bisphosphatase-like protein
MLRAHGECSNNFEENPSENQYKFNSSVRNLSGYNEKELAKGNELVFAASGVTNSELLDGVRFTSTGPIVSSICMRLPSGTVEKSETTLRFKGHPVYRHFLT